MLATLTGILTFTDNKKERNKSSLEHHSQMLNSFIQLTKTYLNLKINTSLNRKSFI
jgi:hypothetical protein